MPTPSKNRPWLRRLLGTATHRDRFRQRRDRNTGRDS